MDSQVDTLSHRATAQLLAYESKPKSVELLRLLYEQREALAMPKQISMSHCLDLHRWILAQAVNLSPFVSELLESVHFLSLRGLSHG